MSTVTVFTLNLILFISYIRVLVPVLDSSCELFVKYSKCYYSDYLLKTNIPVCSSFYRKETQMEIFGTFLLRVNIILGPVFMCL